MLEVDKKYKIAIKRDSQLAEVLKETKNIDGLWNDPERLIGTITQIHSFGFLFKIDNCPTLAIINILWNNLKWVFQEVKE